MKFINFKLTNGCDIAINANMIVAVYSGMNDEITEIITIEGEEDPWEVKGTYSDILGIIREETSV